MTDFAFGNNFSGIVQTGVGRLWEGRSGGASYLGMGIARIPRAERSMGFSSDLREYLQILKTPCEVFLLIWIGA